MNFKLRKNMKKIILISISIIFLISCEQDVDFDLPYKEQVVISSVLFNDLGLTEYPYISKNYSFVHIGRTIPPLDKGDTNNSLIKDANVRIINDDEVFQLSYSLLGYWVNENFIPEEGETYRIEVDYKGKTTSAETTIPKLDYKIESITKTYLKRKDWDNTYYHSYFFYANISTRMNDFAFFVSEDDYLTRSYYYGSVLYTYTKLQKKEFEVAIFGVEFDDLKDTMNFSQKVKYRLDFFDPAFERYWDTQDLGNEESGIFGGGGLNIEGNIKNGIGFFYGSNPKTDSLIVSFN